MPGSLGLGNLKDSHHVADAEFAVVHQEPKHLQPRFIGQGLKKTGRFLHILLSGENIYISGLTNAVNSAPKALWSAAARRLS
jgi:hypothetical protein